jgi:hypothetical protein
MSANCDGCGNAVECENNVLWANAVEQNHGSAIEQATRGKSGRYRKCPFPNTGGLHRTSGDAPLETDPQRAIEREHFVVCGDAIERNRGNVVEQATRGKSGCESKCRFPITGGLHCTSGDAPLETHPPWSHMHNSNSPSSKRTQVGSIAFWVNRNESTRRSTKHRRELNANRKKYKQVHHLKDVKISSTALERIKLLDLDYIKKNVVVCNGGNNESNGIQNRPDIENVSCL